MDDPPDSCVTNPMAFLFIEAQFVRKVAVQSIARD